MRVRTTHCARSGHPEFELEVSKAATTFTESLIDWLETSVGQGTKYQSYEHVQFGSAMLQVRERSSGSLALFEPQPGSMPIVWIDSVEDSVMTTVRQRYVAQSVGLEDDLDFPGPMRTAYICTRVRRGMRVGLIRNEPLENDVGWCVMCTEKDHDHTNPDEIDAITVYEIGLRVPEFLLFQAMPVKTAVLIGGTKPLQVFFDRQQMAIVPGSMLDELIKK